MLGLPAYDGAEEEAEEAEPRDQALGPALDVYEDSENAPVSSSQLLRQA